VNPGQVIDCAGAASEPVGGNGVGIGEMLPLTGPGNGLHACWNLRKPI